MKYLAQVSIGEQFGSPFGQTAGINNLVSLIISISLTVAGLIILFFFIIAGINIISGAGKNNPEQLEKGKKALTSALVGFLVVFVAYWIIRLIEMLTGTRFITAPGF